MNAPTEAEIREAIEASDSWNNLDDAWNALCSAIDDLYDLDEFRRSEQEDLDIITFAAIDRAIRDRAKAELVEALVKAAYEFAAKHPDAPRVAREPVTA